MTVTPFLRLQKPPFESVPWDQAINGNMDTIDAFVARYMSVPNYVGGWLNSTSYVSGQNVLDVTNATIYLCQVTHTSAATPTTFAQDRATHPTYWVATTNVSSASSSMTVSDTPPATTKNGDLWWDSIGAQLYVLYNDGGSLQWVVANNQQGNVGEAPNDSNTYGRKNSAWTPIGVAVAGRNLIHNALFTIAQRGPGPWTTNVYTLDRWVVLAVSDTVSFTQSVMSDANRAQIGDEAATYCLANTWTGNAAAGAYSTVGQPIEDVRRLAGKTVTVSFWAVAGATPKLGVNLVQFFGTGGSPSASVNVAGQAVTLTTGFARYSLTFTLPSVSGKTLGTNGNHSTSLQFWYSSGATNATNAGSVGVQSGTILLWGVQLEITQPGQLQPTPLEKRDPEQELQQCQRFYARVGVLIQNGNANGSLGVSGTLPVTMRAIPTVTYADIGSVNINTPITGQLIAGTVTVTANVTASGFALIVGTLTASADL